MEDIEKIVDKLQTENDRKAANDPVVKASLGLVEAFLREHPVLCYGGTAINNLLPPEERFYNPEFDIADYDFFSKTPQRHAMILANQLAERGIKNVQVRPGMHLGTFKVFADFEGVADITEMEPAIFDKLWKEQIVRDGIHYVTPNFLRMSMYLELSRPQGDVSRWTKVYQRLLLLNKHHPIVCPSAKTPQPKEISEPYRKKAESILRNHNVVLLGLSASQVHAKGKHSWYTPVTMLADKSVIDTLTKNEPNKKSVEGSEILPSYTDILDDNGNVIFRFHETNACHSYHKMKNGIKVASIPTILQFFFAFMYSGASEDDINHLMCVAQRLMDIASRKTNRRFALLTPIDCIGQQETLTDMRKHKAVLYEKLEKNKNSTDFLRYFFTYDPHATPKTQRAKIRDQLRKITRRA
jgi:hypothetical protein